MATQTKKAAGQESKHEDGRYIERPVFGFLLASLHTGASRALWPGVIAAAEQHDVNLICFPGGRLHSQVAYEAQRNAVYDMVGEECLDGLVTWASTMGGVTSPAEINSFHQRYASLPIVSLAEFMGGIPTVSVDSYHGMRALLDHLIGDHGYTRLAFIRGPEGHYYAQERYRAYLDTLQAHNLPFIPELVTRPLRWEAGAEAVTILLDERGLRPQKDFQAVVAVSDLLALWALKTLQERGFQVPADVAVTGFNNTIEERLATPPLTTVELPFYDQGAKAVEILSARWKGETVPALLVLPSRLVVRLSCGCPSKAVANAGAILAGLPGQALACAEVGANLAASREVCIAAIAEECQISPEKAAVWLAPLFEAFISELKETDQRFIAVLEEVLDKAMRENGEIILWQGAISMLRQQVFPFIALQDRCRLETLFAQARIVIGEAEQRSHAFWQWQSERLADNLRETARTLLTAFDMAQLTDALTECLPLLGIPSAYLALYDDPSGSFKDARLVLAYTEHKRLHLDPNGRRFSACQIIPSDLLPQGRRYSLVVEPLFFQDKSLGYAVFELGPHDGDIYELLRSNLSSALQGAMLFQGIQQARLEAEKADRIKTRLLANVSHEMRTPLNIILGYTQDALKASRQIEAGPYPSLVSDLHQIQSNAEHQLRVINDLLDLSRAEIDELDLSLTLLDPRQLLLDAFHSLADQSVLPDVQWKLKIPERLPQVRADPVRLRQIFLNLLSNAKKYTMRGEITLGAEVAPPQIHFWVSDTGLGIDPEQQGRIFEPFVTIESNRRIAGGIGLGLSITRHLVALHGGTMELESQPDQGSTFHVYLPLPALDHVKSQPLGILPSVLLLISSVDEPAREILEICQRHKLEIFYLRNRDDLEDALNKTHPAALAWDLSNAKPSDWTLVRRLRHYPSLSQAPFILYGKLQDEVALTGFVVKSSNPQTLLDAVTALDPDRGAGCVLIVDDDPQVRAAHKAVIEDGLPGYSVRLADGGESALAIMAEEIPALVLLDLVMPDLNGADVLDQMRADARLRQVPVIILSNKVLSYEDAKRIESHTRVTLQSKGIWTDNETIAVLNRNLFGSDSLPVHTSALVKQAIAYLHQNYMRPISRWEIAGVVGVSEDYLSRVFSRELNLSPWDYLNRYRVLQSKHLLLNTSAPIRAVALQVGFKDQAYFSRVFHRITGTSPQAFRASR